MRHLVTLAALLIAPAAVAEPLYVAKSELPDETFFSLTTGCMTGRAPNACVLLGLASQRGGELLGVPVAQAPLMAEYYFRLGCDRDSAIACHLGSELLHWWSQDAQMAPAARQFRVPALPGAASEAVSLAGRACELWVPQNPAIQADRRNDSCLMYADACLNGTVPPSATCQVALDFESRWQGMRGFEPVDGLITM